MTRHQLACIINTLPFDMQPAMFALLDEIAEAQDTLYLFGDKFPTGVICPAIKALVSSRDGHTDSVSRTVLNMLLVS